MDLTQAVDIYCERTGPEFWAEPLNAISNAAFVVAAVWAASTARARGRSEADLWALIVLTGLIGLGSFLFHTYATVWSAIADVLPIWIFVALFIGVATHRIGDVPVKWIVLSALALLALASITLAIVGQTNDASPPHDHSPGLLNGSEQYAPAYLALLIFAALSRVKRSPMAPWVGMATLAFTASLTLRTLDVHVCPALPIGTHYAWHILNGLTIALLLQGLIRTVAAPKAP